MAVVVGFEPTESVNLTRFRGLRPTLQPRSPGTFQQVTDLLWSSVNVHDSERLRPQMRPRAQACLAGASAHVLGEVRRDSTPSVSPRPFYGFPNHSVWIAARGTAELSDGCIVT